MQKYGKIVNNGLILSLTQQEGYKPIRYEEIPEFDQLTQFVIESGFFENEDEIVVTVEVKELEIFEESEVEM